MSRRRWSHERLVLFSQQLAILLDSGFPLIPSLHLLGQQRILTLGEAERICQSLEAGVSLSESLRSEGFPSLYVSFIRAAEEHGEYVFGLRQGESYYREKGEFLRDLGQALLYPAVVLILVILAFLFLVTAVIPRFSELYASMGMELPLFTRLLLGFYGLLRNGFTAILCVAAMIAAAALLVRRLPPEKRWKWTRWLYRFPGVRHYFLYRFTHYLAVQLGALLRAGIPLLTALETMRSLAPWPSLAEGIGRIRARLLAGESFNRSLAAEGGGLFLPAVPHWIALGEETGRLDQSLLTLARAMENVIRERSRKLTHSLEPVLIFLIGVLIAVTVIALFLPMLQLTRAL
ncbi:type II secretion system F family protein [Planifilum fimeticola]